MTPHWGIFWTKSRKALKAGWLITAVLVALYAGLIEPRQRWHGIAMQKATGLAAVAGELSPASPQKLAMTLSAPEQDTGPDVTKATEDRKLVRNANLHLIVKSPAQASERIITLAQNAGGFLVSSEINGGSDAPSASMTVRVPVASFDQVRTRVRQLGLRVESESIEAQDVTKQYVDHEARLRNLRAQEAQYLGILRKAATVNDTLEVSDKLNGVRGAIEEKQAEFEALSKQVEMVAMTITLRAEADTQVFGLHWRPLYQLKIAAREGLDGLGDYAASMASFIFYLPTILLWLFTILVGAAIAWRILRWAARTFFKPAKSQVPQPAS